MRDLTYAFAVVSFWALLGTANPSYAACPSGAEVEDAFCHFFYVYKSGAGMPDPVIANALSLGPTDNTRSIAIIMGVSEYPHLNATDIAASDTAGVSKRAGGGSVLNAARLDVQHLKLFLKNDQKFDEVIVIENDDVNIANISFFLQGYLCTQVVKYNKPRIVVAYSGHGVQSNAPGSTGSLLLSGARSTQDFQNMLSMGVLKSFLTEIGPQSFQLLALINACFGGDVFSDARSGGNPFVSDGKSARALTAGAPDELVYSLGGEGQGSIFFDSLIENIRSGDFEATFWLTNKRGQNSEGRRGIVLLGDFLKAITQDVEYINRSQNKAFSRPWEGSVLAPPVVSTGGFFFLSQHKGFANNPTTLRAPQTGPVSSVMGHPDLKVFNRPQEYEVRGIDVSAYNGPIDWQTLVLGRYSGEAPRFAYMRATIGARLQDLAFAQNWSQAGKAGGNGRLDRGAYHVFDFCDSSSRQVKNIVDHVRLDPTSLPLAIDVEYSGDAKGRASSAWQRSQSACLDREGLDAERRKLMELLKAVETHYGKVPVIFGNEIVFGELLEDAFKKYPVWLHDYDAETNGTRLPGSNPWTVWQYTNKGSVAGISGTVDQNAFFGTEATYNEYKLTGANIALSLATGKTAPQ